MKITRRQLSRLIKEEISKMSEATRSKPWAWELPGSSVPSREPSYDEQWQEEKAGYHGAEPSANILPGSSAESGEGCVDGDQDGICDFADSDLDDDGIVDATQAPTWWIESGEPPLDVVDGDTGEIHAQWDDPDNWNDEPFSGMYADFVIWLGKNEEDYKRHPDSERLSQEHGNHAWYVRHKDTDLSADHSTPPSPLVGKYNLPSTGWGIPEPDRGTTSEGTSIDEMPASWQQILRNVL